MNFVKYFCSYSIQRFLLTKHYISFSLGVRDFFFFNLALRQENKTSFYLTWHWDREFLSFSSFFWFTWHWIRRMSFFLIAFFIAFVLSFGRGGGRRGKGGGRSYRGKQTEKEGRDDCIRKIDLLDAKRHKGLVPFITTSISFLSLRGEVTECVYMHCGD